MTSNETQGGPDGTKEEGTDKSGGDVFAKPAIPELSATVSNVYIYMTFQKNVITTSHPYFHVLKCR